MPHISPGVYDLPSQRETWSFFAGEGSCGNLHAIQNYDTVCDSVCFVPIFCNMITVVSAINHGFVCSFFSWKHARWRRRTIRPWVANAICSTLTRNSPMRTPPWRPMIRKFGFRPDFFLFLGYGSWSKSSLGSRSWTTNGFHQRLLQAIPFVLPGVVGILLDANTSRVWLFIGDFHWQLLISPP